MDYNYLILGAGQQGTAAAYDLARWGEAERVTLGDLELERAEAAAARVNRLLGRRIAQAQQLDVSAIRTLEEKLRPYDLCLSAVPYYFNLAIAQAALAAQTGFCDLGGNTAIVRGELALDQQARQAGITIVPDCGLAPGLANILAVYAMERLEQMGGRPQEMRIYCGGLPQKPRSPLGYKLVFSIEGLTNEYLGPVYVLRRGQVKVIESLSEREELLFPPPLGRLEAFTTSGGSSTCPWSFQGRLDSYEYKTLRYPGHLAQLKTLVGLGLLSQEPVELAGQPVVPQELFHRVAAPHLSFPADEDLVVLRVRCIGQGDDAPLEVQYDLLDYQDRTTGFSAMERLTGFPAAIVAAMCAQGQIGPGACLLEQAVPAGQFMSELLRRGIKPIETSVKGADNG